jgi:hypothetical protein
LAHARLGTLNTYSIVIYMNEYGTTPGELEPIETATFTEYEVICNQYNTGSRKSGILSEEMYGDIIIDPTTSFVIIEGKRIPALFDVSYGLSMGYEVSRAVEYAGGENKNIKCLAVPISCFSESIQKDIVERVAEEAAKEPSGMALYFADPIEQGHGVDSEALGKFLPGNMKYEEIPLLDSRAEYSQASLSLYVCDFTNVKGNNKASATSLSGLQEYYDVHTLKDIDDYENSTLLRRGDSFNESELDEIWRLYQDRFQFLGENHPISMEDTREDFMSIFTSPDTMVSIRYEGGKPVCLTYLVEDFSKLYWLNEKYLEKLQDETDSSRTSIFFPGVVATGAGNNYAAQVIEIFRNAVADAGMDVRVIFENTNLSETYIPKIVFDIVDASGQFHTEYPKKVDEIEYKLIQL